MLRVELARMRFLEYVSVSPALSNISARNSRLALMRTAGRKKLARRLLNLGGKGTWPARGD
jgi:hypothetical protein